jgi:hypothetical protein
VVTISLTGLEYRDDAVVPVGTDFCAPGDVVGPEVGDGEMPYRSTSAGLFAAFAPQEADRHEIDSAVDDFAV